MEEKKTRVLTVYEYFDYSIFAVNGQKVEEAYCADANPHFEAITENTEDVEKIVGIIKSRVKGKTLSDVVMVIVYQMFMPEEAFEKLKIILTGLTEEEVILQTYRQNLYNKGAIIIRGAFPVVFQERISAGKIKS